jgi:hypothetical protein
VFTKCRMIVLVAGTILLCSTSISWAFPALKDKDPAAQSRPYGVMVSAVDCPRQGDAVDVFVEENDSDGIARDVPIFQRIQVVAIEDATTPGAGRRQYLVLLDLEPCQMERLQAASKRGRFIFPPHNPLWYDEYIIPRAGNAQFPALIGD